MLRPPPKLFLYSCGWAEVPDHQETISGGLVFDIGDVGTDYENEEQGGSPREASCWQVFGGEGSDLDHVLAKTEKSKISWTFSEASVSTSLPGCIPFPRYPF